MLASEERRFVPTDSPVKVVSGLPTLFRSHRFEDRDLLRARLFVRQHSTPLCRPKIPSASITVMVDGPAYVARNVWITVMRPTYFLEPIHYFQVSVENWEEWP